MKDVLGQSGQKRTYWVKMLAKQTGAVGHGSTVATAREVWIDSGDFWRLLWNDGSLLCHF